MATAKVKGTMQATISAKVIRADGTEENLGIISATDADAEKAISLLRAMGVAAATETDEDRLAAANAATETANQEERQRLIDEGHEVT